MTEKTATTDFVVITAKRLDSDEVSETVVGVPTPRSELAMRNQLAGLVGPRYPDAEFRSFANSAATFLAPKLLIVAVYRPSSSEDDNLDEDADDDSQQQLFAA